MLLQRILRRSVLDCTSTSAKNLSSWPCLRHSRIHCLCIATLVALIVYYLFLSSAYHPTVSLQNRGSSQDVLRPPWPTEVVAVSASSEKMLDRAVIESASSQSRPASAPTEPSDPISFTRTGGDVECELPFVDPWDPEVLPHISPQKDPLLDCKPNRTMLTELADGVLRMTNSTDSTTVCQYRCLFAIKEEKYGAENWTVMEQGREHKVQCDFVDVECNKGGNNTVFRYVHMQVKMQRDQNFRLEDATHPSIIIIVLDSVSSSNAIRALPETREILRQRYGATTFQYHNKDGLNSRPNAYAMFLGERIYDLEPNPALFPNNTHLAEVPDSECEKGFNVNHSVVYDFLRNGYGSMVVEDWTTSFSWPYCTGYAKIPFNHWGRTFSLRTNEPNGFDPSGPFDEFMYLGECQNLLDKTLHYNDLFLLEYKGIAKFSYSWITALSHQSPDLLYKGDRKIANFFRKHVDELSGSFVFLMSDHGTRFGGLRNTKTGNLEDDNPLFIMSVPKFLRDNGALMQNLLRNSKRHTSQYDLFATLYDIANIAPPQNFSDWNFHNFSAELGPLRGGKRAQSLLRPISHDRSCETMYIPREYCLCAEHWVDLSVDGEEAIRAGKAVIDLVNSRIADHFDICEKLSFVGVKSASKLLNRGSVIIKVVANALPSDGLYEALVTFSNATVAAHVTPVTRNDKFGSQGNCIASEDLRPVCYCKNYTVSTATSSTRSTTTATELPKPAETTEASPSTLQYYSTTALPETTQQQPTTELPKSELATSAPPASQLTANEHATASSQQVSVP